MELTSGFELGKTVFLTGKLRAKKTVLIRTRLARLVSRSYKNKLRQFRKL